MLPGRLTTFCLAAILLALTAGANSAVLSSPDLSGTTGQSLVAPLMFSAEGQAVSGVQFDLDWDDALDIKLVLGDRLRQSSKLLYSAVMPPRGVRCVIIGMDQVTLADGELLKVFVTAGAAGTAQLRISNAIATDGAGNPVALRATPVNVSIQGGGTSIPLLSQGVLSAASLLPGGISPGDIVTLLGYFRSPSPVLLFNGIQAPILYAGPGQVNAIVPFGLGVDQPANLEIRVDGQPAGSLTLPAAPATPAVFTQAATGVGPGAVLNQDYSVNSYSNPAAAGSILMVFGTGFGSLDPPAQDGQIAGAIARTTLPVTASIGGLPADVLYAGAAPGLVAGMVQVNLRVPSGLTPNSAAPLSLTVGVAPTPVGVTVSIR